MRTIADLTTTSEWSTALWSGPAGSAPFNGTWGNNVATAVSTLETLLNTDPGASEGVSVGGHAGDLRFVVQALNPLLGASQLWAGGNWGTEHWSSGGGAWQDISSLVRGISWDTGSDSPEGLPAVGVTTLTLTNTNGAASPWHNAGTFASPGSRPWLRAGLLIRFGVLSASLGAGMPLALDNFSSFFTGRVESIVEDTSENTDGWVTITIAETSTDLAAACPSVMLRNGDTVSQSILAVLNAFGIAYQADLRVPNEDGLVQDATVGTLGTDSHTGLEVLQLLADSLHWAICSDGRGKIEAVPRHLSGTTLAITLSNNPAAGEYPLVKIKPYSNTERVLNQAAVARVGGPLQTVQDTQSQAQFGILTGRYGVPRNDLVVNTDAQAALLAARLVSLYAFDDLGIDEVAFDMDMDPVNLPAILTYLATYGREAVGFTIRWQHPSGNIYSEFVTIQHASHAITMEGSQLKWTGSFNVERAISQDI